MAKIAQIHKRRGNIGNLKPNKATGLDKTPTDLLKSIKDRTIINYILSLD